MTETLPEIVVPALAVRDAGRKLDEEIIDLYARRAAATWIDRFILSGSTARGDLFTVSERAAILDIWLKIVPTDRLVACCWCKDDITEAAGRGVQPMAVMRSPTEADALSFLEQLPTDSYLYSHPMYGGVVLDVELAASAQSLDVLPAGVKLAKVSVSDIEALRTAVGQQMVLWDGTSRHIEASVKAGANGVVATPLSCIPCPFPPRSSATIQAFVDALQARLDRLGSRNERSSHLTSLAFGTT